MDSRRSMTSGIVGICFALLINLVTCATWFRYTSSSLNSLLIFTKSFSCSLSYKKFCVSSSSVGDVGDWFLDGAGDGPLMESVGSAASSFLGVFFVLTIGATLSDVDVDIDVDGSLWHSTISIIFSRSGEFLVSSLSQILFEGFSEKRRCWEIKIRKHLNKNVSTGIPREKNSTYILIAWRNIFGTFRLPTENTLRSVASDELDGIKAATLGRHKNGWIYSRTLATLRYHSWWLFSGPMRMNVLKFFN